MKTAKNFNQMTASEKYNEFKTEVDNDSHIDRMPTEVECEKARKEDVTVSSENKAFFFAD